MKHNTLAYDICLNKGVLYLKKQALQKGGFTALSFSKETKRNGCYIYRTTFNSSLILNSLASTPHTEDIIESSLGHLKHQKSDKWSFNYWDRSSPEYKTFPYPDDLDDTFCALIALYKHYPESNIQTAMAAIVKLLIAAETKPGGPYKTWLTNDPNWQDIDLAVNANIAYFLSLASNRLPSLDEYIADHIDRSSYTSPYYPTEWPIYYYLARICPYSHQRKLSRYIQSKIPTITNSLQTALALSALCHLPCRKIVLTKLGKMLAETQQSDGSWQTAPYCLDPSRDGQIYYNGSPSLSTAFAIEALLACQKRLVILPVESAKSITNEDRVHQSVTSQARAYFSKLEPDLAKSGMQYISKLTTADSSHQITLLPYKFAQSLKANLEFKDQFYINLGLANLYGWVAYTIYDDFLDEEGQPSQLPIANVAMRQSLHHFKAACPNPVFMKEVSGTFNIIDGANAWEVNNCRNSKRLPDYGDLSKLAERSMGHGLAPLAILLEAGHSLDNPDVRAIHQAFKHYLITRQIDDDSHDWADDYKNNHINYVVAAVLEENQSKQPSLSTMRSQFWHSTLLRICSVMSSQISQATKVIENNSLLKSTNILTELFERQRKSVAETLTKHSQAEEFLVRYSKSDKVINK